jgi:hypothetical protein
VVWRSSTEKPVIPAAQPLPEIPIMTDVVFLRDGTDHDVFAVFPQFCGSVSSLDFVVCYHHIGQHSEAHLDYCQECTEVVDPSEYAELHKELERIGYDDLKVVRLYTIDSADRHIQRRNYYDT